MPLLSIPFPRIDPVIFELGPIAVRWYALAYIAGILFAVWYAKRLVSSPRLWEPGEPPAEPWHIDDLLLWSTLGVILGGRLGYVIFYSPAFFLQNPAEILALWSGGMSFHGGFLGVVIACWIYARRHGIRPIRLIDVAACGVPVGLGLGRIANFINAELYGRTTDVPWAMVFPGGGPEPRHPSQLYEAVLEGLVLFLVLRFASHRYGALARPGLCSGIFAIGYAASRVLVEFAREPDAHIGYLAGDWLTLGMVLSLPLMAAGVWLIARAQAAPVSLERELAAIISAEGPMGVDRYMGLCLGHSRYGYYMRRDPLGRAGDFTTAPEISQMFGELIGVWCAAAWQAMGAPASLRLVELGPGRGTLMADVLRAARVVPGFLDAARVALVETSPVLRQIQKATLSAAGVPIQWQDRLEEVAPGPTLVVANEFFDALPVRQLVRTDAGWHERLVGLDASGKLAFGLAPHALPADLLPRWAHSAAPGEIVEVSPARLAVAQAIGARLATMGGAALIIDYGHVRSGPGDTLQAVRAHAFADVLESPGECDLTSHVDFEALGAALQQGGAVVHGPMSQGAFLSAMGLAERAEVLKRSDPDAAADIDAASARLAADSQMGQLFKVIAATSPDLPPPYPFQDPER